MKKIIWAILLVLAVSVDIMFVSSIISGGHSKNDQAHRDRARQAHIELLQRNHKEPEGKVRIWCITHEYDCKGYYTEEELEERLKVYYGA